MKADKAFSSQESRSKNWTNVEKCTQTHTRIILLFAVCWLYKIKSGFPSGHKSEKRYFYLIWRGVSDPGTGHGRGPELSKPLIGRIMTGSVFSSHLLDIDQIFRVLFCFCEKVRKAEWWSDESVKRRRECLGVRRWMRFVVDMLGWRWVGKRKDFHVES